MRLLPAPDKRELLSNQEYPVSLPPDADALTLAPLRAGDMPAVMRIQAQCYSAIVPESLQSMSAKQQAAPGTCHAAWRQGALVGYLLALPVRALALPALDSPACTIDPAADALYLHDLALAPAARGWACGARCWWPSRARRRTGRARASRRCHHQVRMCAPSWPATAPTRS